MRRTQCSRGRRAGRLLALGVRLACLRLRLLQGNAEPEGRAFAHLALDPDMALVRQHQILYQEQPDAGSLDIAARPLALDPLELAEQLLLRGLWNAQTLIFHAQQYRPLIGFQPSDDTDFAPFGRIFDGVRDQVLQDVLNFVHVRLGDDMLRLEVNDQGMLIGHAALRMHDLFRRLAHVHLLEVHLDAFHALLLDAGDIEQVVDEAAEAVNVGLDDAVELAPVFARVPLLVFVVQQRADEALHRRERRAQFVRDDGDELRLHALQVANVGDVVEDNDGSYQLIRIIMHPGG